MDGPEGDYAEWNKSEKNIIWSCLYMESEKKKHRKQIKFVDI